MNYCALHNFYSPYNTIEKNHVQKHWFNFTRLQAENLIWKKVNSIQEVEFLFAVNCVFNYVPKSLSALGGLAAFVHCSSFFIAHLHWLLLYLGFLLKQIYKYAIRLNCIYQLVGYQ